VELKARMQSGSYVFDQTYSAAPSSPTVQVAITQAENVLTSHGAVSFTGPMPLSSNHYHGVTPNHIHRDLHLSHHDYVSAILELAQATPTRGAPCQPAAPAELLPP
jgi:hypothetical protein